MKKYYSFSRYRYNAARKIYRQIGTNRIFSSLSDAVKYALDDFDSRSMCIGKDGVLYENDSFGGSLVSECTGNGEEDVVLDILRDGDYDAYTPEVERILAELCPNAAPKYVCFAVEVTGTNKKLMDSVYDDFKNYGGDMHWGWNGNYITVGFAGVIAEKAVAIILDDLKRISAEVAIKVDSAPEETVTKKGWQQIQDGVRVAK